MAQGKQLPRMSSHVMFVSGNDVDSNRMRNLVLRDGAGTHSFLPQCGKLVSIRYARETLHGNRENGMLNSRRSKNLKQYSSRLMPARTITKFTTGVQLFYLRSSSAERVRPCTAAERKNT